MNDYFKDLIDLSDTDKSDNAEESNGAKNTPGTLFVAFSGKKQVGKDTAAEMVQEILTEAGHRVTITAFAEALKSIVTNVLGLPESSVSGSNIEKNAGTHIVWDNLPTDIRLKYSTEGTEPRSGPMSGREVMQVLGTDIFRSMFNDNVWAHSPFRPSWTFWDVVIITDCRFPNEKLAVESNDGILVRLTRDTGFEDDHISETALDGHSFEHVYDNNGTFEDMRHYLRRLLEYKGVI